MHLEMITIDEWGCHECISEQARQGVNWGRSTDQDNSQQLKPSHYIDRHNIEKKKKIAIRRMVAKFAL
jgi:hypothetical protein